MNNGYYQDVLVWLHESCDAIHTVLYATYNTPDYEIHFKWSNLGLGLPTADYQPANLSMYIYFVRHQQKEPD